MNLIGRIVLMLLFCLFAGWSALLAFGGCAGPQSNKAKVVRDSFTGETVGGVRVSIENDQGGVDYNFVTFTKTDSVCGVTIETRTLQQFGDPIEPRGLAIKAGGQIVYDELRLPGDYDITQGMIGLGKAWVETRVGLIDCGLARQIAYSKKVEFRIYAKSTNITGVADDEGISELKRLFSGKVAPSGGS